MVLVNFFSVFIKSLALYIAVFLFTQNASASAVLGFSATAGTLIFAIAPLSAVLFTLKTLYHVGMLSYYRYKEKHVQGQDEKGIFQELAEAQKQKMRKSAGISAITWGLTGLNFIFPGITLITGIVAGGFTLGSLAVSYVAERYSTKNSLKENTDADADAGETQENTIREGNASTSVLENIYHQSSVNSLGNDANKRTPHYHVIDQHPERNKPRKECPISSFGALYRFCFSSEKPTHQEDQNNGLSSENERRNSDDSDLDYNCLCGGLFNKSRR
jgi:hypothetical protein